jgi:Protein of unknown function (DUF2934)
MFFPTQRIVSTTHLCAKHCQEEALMTTSVPGIQGSKPIEPTGPAATNEGFSDDQVQEIIRLRAYELYQERGCEDGHDFEDWARAEAEIKVAIGAETVKAA